MKHSLFVLLWLLIAAPLFAQATPFNVRALRFDYRWTDYYAFGIDRFEVSWDGQLWNSIGIPPRQSDAQTTQDGLTHSYDVPSILGQAFRVRACNASACGAPSGAVLSIPEVPPPPPPSGESTLAVQFDYLWQDYYFFGITRYEVQWDIQLWGSAGIPTPQEDGQTAPGAHTYPLVVPFSVGPHTVRVRACNTIGCSPPSSFFSFAVVP